MALFQVKIWYVSGTYEEVNNAPAGTARTIYAEARDSDRVEAAELHGAATHKLYESCRGGVDTTPSVG